MVWLSPDGVVTPETTLTVDADDDGHADAGPGDDHASHQETAGGDAHGDTHAHGRRHHAYHPKHARRAKAARAAKAYAGFVFAKPKAYAIGAHTSAALASASDVAAAPLPGMPSINTDPTASVAIYLDFNGDAGGQTAYDEDGDPTSFNATEQAHIAEAVRQVSIYFAPFDVTITTVKPTIPFAWGMIGNSISGGYSYVGVFPNTTPESFNNSGDARTRQSGLVHEYGHNFGLWHQSDYNLLGVKTNEYSSGFDSTHGPIMGVDYAQNVHKWFIGHPNNSATSLQDDMAIIAGKIKAKEPAGGDGYRADDFAGTIASATSMNDDGAGLRSIAGNIERRTDVDAFSFITDGSGPVNVDVAPLAPSGLAPQWEVRDASGNLLYAKDDTDQRNGTNNDEQSTVSLPAGTYYLLVKGHGDYGDQGLYTAYVRALPTGWDTADIGNVNVRIGGAGYDAGTGTFAVSGGGADIWGTADAFRFAYTTLSGDGSIVARVAANEATDVWAKAGVMIRNDLSAGAANAFAAFGAGNGTTTFQTRTGAGGSTTSSTNAVGATPPYWMKLVRAGNTFTAYRSANGTTWTQQGTAATITMGTTVYVGLAVTAHNSGLVNDAAFDNVTIIGNTNVQPTPNGLAAPTGLTAAPAGTTGSGVVLNWADGAGETGYVIERSVDNSHWSTVTTTAANAVTYTDAGLFGSMRYFYRLRAKTAAGNSDPSASVAVVNRPTAPGTVTVYSYSTTSLVVNWRDVSGDTGYRIERSTDGTNFTTLATVGVNVPSYYNTGLTVGTNYWYRIVALSAQGESAPSTVYAASTRLATVGGLSFTAKASNHLDLSWTALAGATGYRIERSTDSTTFTTLANVASTTTYSDTSVSPLGTYYYRVVGTNALTESGAASAVIYSAAPSAGTLPAMWAAQDVGSVGGGGASDYAAGTWTTVSGGGTLVATGTDAFRYTYAPLVGDGQIIARVATQDTALGHALKSGVMIRESLNNNARYAMVDLTPASGVVFQSRATAGAAAVVGAATPASVVAPYWVKLVRAGNTFTGYSSTDGSTWSVVGSATVAMGAAAYVGLAATSATTATLSASTFSNVQISDKPPTVATAASASMSAADTADLSVLGADDHGEANLTYTWAATGLPAGAPRPRSGSTARTPRRTARRPSRPPARTR